MFRNVNSLSKTKNCLPRGDVKQDQSGAEVLRRSALFTSGTLMETQAILPRCSLKPEIS